MKNKLIPKKQTAWGKLEYNGPTYSDIQEKMRKEDPEAYNRLLIEVARSLLPNSEVVTYIDAEGKPRRATTVIGMSGADPIGLLYVEGVALNPVFKGLGKVAEYGLAKAGNKWARAKVLSREIDKSNIVANSLSPKPKVRTRVGDIEIDNPLLYYRLGSKEMADDFLETGIVDTDGAYSNPMFALSHLWYGIPKRLTNRKNTEIVTKRGRKLNFGKRNEDVAKTHLLVSNPSTDMIGANHSAHAANTLIYKQRNSPISDSNLIRYELNLGKDFVSKYLDAYYNGDLENRIATIVTYPGNSRRIPAIKGAANKSNTLLYEYDPNYGYRLVSTSPEKTSLKLLERPSKLSESERLGVPKGLRNLPIKQNGYNHNLVILGWKLFNNDILASIWDNPDLYRRRISDRVVDYIKQRKEVGKSLEDSRDFILSTAVKNSKETNLKIADRLGLPRQAEYDLLSKPVIYHNTFGLKNYNYKGVSSDNVGGYYDRTKKTINLRENYPNLLAAKAIPFHENLHAQGYGPSAVNKWKILYLIDKDKVMNMSKRDKDYFLSSEELPVHTATLGKSWGVKPGQSYPGDEAFDEMLYNNGIGGASYYLKYVTPKDKRRFWRTLNGTMFGLSPAIINKNTQPSN